MENVIIIGAGLSGLTTAYNLKKRNIPFKIIEAQDRLGGRIETVQGLANTPMDMGATWFNDVHVNLIALINELEIPFFFQHSEGKAIFQTKSFEPPQIFYVPNSEQSSYRFKEGTTAIINKLKDIVADENIVLNTSKENPTMQKSWFQLFLYKFLQIMSNLFRLYLSRFLN